jgi:hypothetical protein
MALLRVPVWIRHARSEIPLVFIGWVKPSGARPFAVGFTNLQTVKNRPRPVSVRPD